MIEAALSNSEKVVTDLLKHGASVNFPKVNNKTVAAPCHNPILIATGLELTLYPLRVPNGTQHHNFVNI